MHRSYPDIRYIDIDIYIYKTADISESEISSNFNFLYIAYNVFIFSVTYIYSLQSEKSFLTLNFVRIKCREA